MKAITKELIISSVYVEVSFSGPAFCIEGEMFREMCSVFRFQKLVQVLML